MEYFGPTQPPGDAVIKTKNRPTLLRSPGPVSPPDVSDPDFTLLQLQSELENQEGGDKVARVRTIGRILLEKRRYSDALPVFEALLALEPTSVQTQETLARCLERLGRWGEAVARYQIVVSADPERADTLVAMGLCMLRQDLHITALAAFNNCLRLKPEHVGALLGKATCLRLAGQTAEANAVYREAIRVQPEIEGALGSLIEGACEPPPEAEAKAAPNTTSNFTELENIIASAVTAEDYVTAAEHCRALTVQAPDYYEAWFNLGVFEQRNSNLAAAAEAFRNAARHQPLSLDSLQALAQVYHLLGDMKAAEAGYRAALALVPDAPDLLWNLGLVLEERGDLAVAEQTFSRLVKSDQDRGEAWFRLGLMRLRLNDWEGAIVAFRRALELGAKTFESNYNLGLAYWKMDRISQAAECFRAALKMQTNFAQAQRGLAAAALREGDYVRAGDLHRRLVERGDACAEVLFNLAVFEHRADRLHSAIEYYRQALKLDPNLAGVSASLDLAQRTLSARRQK